MLTAENKETFYSMKTLVRSLIQILLILLTRFF